jgi:gas vesicle protein
MHRVRNTLISVGAGIVSAGLARAVSQLELNDLLRPLRLSRRSNPWGEKLAFLGAGVAVGGLCALLFAPNNGQETRSKLAQKVRGLSSRASNEVRETQEDGTPAVKPAQAEFGNGPAAPSRPFVAGK